MPTNACSRARLSYLPRQTKRRVSDENRGFVARLIARHFQMLFQLLVLEIVALRISNIIVVQLNERKPSRVGSSSGEVDSKLPIAQSLSARVCCTARET